MTVREAHDTLTFPDGKTSDRDDSANLTILGVIHRDPDGALLLAGWLGTEPAAVTLEFSDYGLKYREAEGKA